MKTNRSTKTAYIGGDVLAEIHHVLCYDVYSPTEPCSLSKLAELFMRWASSGTLKITLKKGRHSLRPSHVINPKAVKWICESDCEGDCQRQCCGHLHYDAEEFTKIFGALDAGHSLSITIVNRKLAARKKERTTQQRQWYTQSENESANPGEGGQQ